MTKEKSICENRVFILDNANVVALQTRRTEEFQNRMFLFTEKPWGSSQPSEGTVFNFFRQVHFIKRVRVMGDEGKMTTE